MNISKQSMVTVEEICGITAHVCQVPELAQQPDRNLYEDQLMDSLAFLQLMYTLEDRYGVEIYPTRIRREELSSPRQITALVQRLLQTGC